MPHYLIQVGYNTSGLAGLVKRTSGPDREGDAEEAVRAMSTAAESSYRPAAG